jgi:hypothetical protein
MYYAAIAFSLVALVAAMFVGDVSQGITENVAVHLQNDKSAKEKKLYTEPV